MSLSTLSPKIKHLESFLAQSQRRRYSAKSVVICPMDSCGTLYLIVKGTVNILLEDDSGKELILTALHPGKFFGELGLFDSESRKQKRSALVVAKTECEVAALSYEKFRQLVEQDTRLLYEVIRQMAERIRYTTCKAYDLTSLDITGRVATTLRDLCKQPGAVTHPDGIQVKITRQEIARIISCSREMVGRVLKKLEEQGVIQTAGRTILVFNPLQARLTHPIPEHNSERPNVDRLPRLPPSRTYSTSV